MLSTVLGLNPECRGPNSLKGKRRRRKQVDGDGSRGLGVREDEGKLTWQFTGAEAVR